MRISARTVQILKNFSTINQSLWFKQGNTIKTVSPVKTVMCKATIAETFDREFGIYDLSKFLGVLSIFNDPDITITNSYVSMRDHSQKVDFTHVSKDIVDNDVDKMYEKEVVLPSTEIEFDLTTEQQQQMVRALSVLQLPHIAVCGENGKLLYKGIDCNNTSANKYEIEVGTTSSDFQIVFKSENMKLISSDYKVIISSKGIGQFTANDIQYWIAAESNISHYGS